MSTATDNICPLCGEPLSAGAPGCMRCLLRGGLDEPAQEEFPPNDTSREFGDYEIARRQEDGEPWELGRGAMGVTYRGYDSVLHNAVALKVIDADLAAHPRAQARFLREARAAAGLRHPNIAGVHRFGVCPDGKCYYAMELVEGETLEERVRRNGPMSVDRALAITEEVANALLAAEKCGVVHRDLKPANIMLTADGHVKVIDFGLAKAAASPTNGQDPELTIGGFVGTPGFASPEQFDGDLPLDTRSDIFSLGVTLWYLLTGSLPFLAPSLKEIRQQQLGGELPIAQLTKAHVPKPVIELLRDLLAADLTHRPQSARALLDRLRSCREQLPSAHGRWRKFARAAAAVAVIAGGAWYFVTPRTPPGTEKSIAVLPFENLSADKDSAFFSDGMQNDIIASLGRVAGLKVISRTSVASYRASSGGHTDLRATARDLGVAYLLEGNVQRASNRVRVNVQLISAQNEAQVWSQRYDRELADVFAIQDELAEQIAHELHVRLSPAERTALQSAPTENLAAYDLHLRARQLLDAFSDSFQSRDKLPEAIRLLNDAVAQDPGFLRAWCDLAKAHTDLYWYGFDHTVERIALAGAAIERTVQLSPDAGETHLALAEYHYHAFRDYERARTELALARRTMPNTAEIPFLSGVIDRRQGHWNESERNLRRALELDPRNTKLHENLAINFHSQRRYPETEELLVRALAIAPGSVQLRQARARLALDARADPHELREALSATLQEDPDAAADVAEGLVECALCERDAAGAEHALSLVAPGGIPVHTATFPRAWFEGVIARTFGNKARALAAFRAARAEAQRAVDAQPDFAFGQSVLGLIEASVGHREEAIRAGRRAVELLPVSRDAIDGPELLVNLAQILAWSDEDDEAMTQLEEAARIPGQLSYGLLKLHPRWDPLRGNPRFEALVEKLKPAGN